MWPAAHELLSYLKTHLPPIPLVILELGAGCGFLGLSLAQVRPDCRLLLTERETGGAFAHLCANVAATVHCAANATAVPLDWSDSAQIARVEEELMEAVSCKGGRLPLVVVGSELVYNYPTCEALAALLERLLTAEAEH